MFQAFPPQNSVALTQAVCGGLTVELKVTLGHLKLCGRKFLDLESGLQSKMAHSLLGAECNLSVSAVLVRSSSSLIAELGSPTSEVLTSNNKVQTEVVWQISILDDVKSDIEEVMDGLSCSTTLSASLGSGSRL
jgi:E3 ubiquitin-protein ligase HUWE1